MCKIFLKIKGKRLFLYSAGGVLAIKLSKYLCKTRVRCTEVGTVKIVLTAVRYIWNPNFFYNFENGNNTI